MSHSKPSTTVNNFEKDTETTVIGRFRQLVHMYSIILHKRETVDREVGEIQQRLGADIRDFFCSVNNIHRILTIALKDYR